MEPVEERRALPAPPPPPKPVMIIVTIAMTLVVSMTYMYMETGETGQQPESPTRPGEAETEDAAHDQAQTH